MTKKTHTNKFPITFVLVAVVIVGIIACCVIGYHQYLYGGISTINTEVNFETQLFENARENFENPRIVLEEKEMLIEKIKSIPFYLYTASTHEILNDMFVHELVHHIRYITSGSTFSNEKYFAMYLDEVITDLIPYAMQPKMFASNNKQSGYVWFYEPVNKYLAVFGEDALKAYFYSYDEFFGKLIF